jgi:hypothetical protein
MEMLTHAKYSHPHNIFLFQRVYLKLDLEFMLSVSGRGRTILICSTLLSLFESLDSTIHRVTFLFAFCPHNESFLKTKYFVK